MDSENEDWKKIKEGIREIKNVCEKLEPLIKGVQCLGKINDFEIEMLKIIKGEKHG